MTYNILALSGSLRKNSYNSALLRTMKERAPEGMTIEIVDINFALYNQDNEMEMPSEIAALKEKIVAADGVLIATPEYNRSMSSALSNMFDWTSRPWGQNSWPNKPAYVVGASMGPIGTALAQYDVKKTLMYLGAIVLGQPEFYLGTAQTKFDEQNVLTDETTLGFVDNSLTAFAGFIDRLR